jgi:Transposase DDE domain
VRLIAASEDPTTLTPESTWYMTTSIPLAEASAAQVYARYRLRDWIEHYYKAVKHELGWADFQVRPARAIVRHWQLVMLAYTFSLLAGVLPAVEDPTIPATMPSVGEGKKITAPSGVAGHLTARPRLAVPLGTSARLLAAVVQRTTAARTRGAARACRSVAPTPCPNLTNQRLVLCKALKRVCHGLQVGNHLRFQGRRTGNMAIGGGHSDDRRVQAFKYSRADKEIEG